MSKVRGLCVLDVDGTLIEEEVIDILGSKANCEQEVSQLTRRAMSGELDFESSLKKRVSLLKGISVDVFDQVYKELHLSKNAQQFISILQENKIAVGIISGGFVPIVERLANSLGIHLFAANQLEINNGRLTGRLVGQIITREVKEKIFLQWANELEISLDRTIAIGDGANDLKMLKKAGIGVAFCAKDILKKEIKGHIDERDLVKVLDLIDFL